LKIAVLTFPKDNEKNSVSESIRFFPLDELELLFLSGYPETEALESCFYRNGLKYLVQSHHPLEKDKIMIACRSRFIVSREDQAFPWPEIGLKIYLPERATTIAGIHFPQSQYIQAQNSFFQSLRNSFQTQMAKRTILIGNFSIQSPNFNTILDFKHYFQEVTSLGWIDAWRTVRPMTYEQIWYSRVQQEIRLNLVFLSPLLRESLLNAYHCYYFTNNKNARAASRALIVELA